MGIRPELDANSNVPLYRQLGVYLQRLIETGELLPGDRLPPTRELAGQLGLNRTTVSSAYDLLEQGGLIKGSVGRGSFVCDVPAREAPGVNWSRALTASVSTSTGASRHDAINFSASRPSENLFPVVEFRECCAEVLASDRIRSLLQLGSPSGYEPLRQFLLERAEYARETDDILITSGCQQAVDLLRRALVRAGDKVAIEEPVYPGLRNLFLEAGAELIGVNVTAEGADPYSVQKALDGGARVIVLTPSFQNPTGASIPTVNRRTIVSMARAAGAVVIENDIYSELAYHGPTAPRLKSLDSNVILLGSFSKIAFPGMRCGWIIAPKPVIRRVTELKQLADLHTDQLSQAFLLRFAESGRLAKHQEQMIAAGRERLRALEQACHRHLPDCRFRTPDGGMNLWLDLPSGLDSSALRGLAQQAGVDYLPGRYFSISRPLDSGLRLSFAGLDPDEIRRGIAILGTVISNATGLRDDASRPTLALV
ncbi:MAG TPA: PLP-dependent aminotransferase family protein [Bryobacteraceae bacterium]|nr:PLP-dependent aminotransferase family protein [Bryobacteraceae bacterium]